MIKEMVNFLKQSLSFLTTKLMSCFGEERCPVISSSISLNACVFNRFRSLIAFYQDGSIACKSFQRNSYSKTSFFWLLNRQAFASQT